MTKRNEKGFTLVELLVVMAIIGLLIGIALAGIQVARSNQRDTARKAILDDVRTALESYYGNNSSTYPAQTAAGITAAGTTINVLKGGVVQTALDESKNGLAINFTYVACTGKASGNGNADMTYTTSGTGYVLGVKLENSSNCFIINQS